MTWHWLTSLPTWLPVLRSCGLFSRHASVHAMPSPSAGPFYVLFFLPKMLPTPFHTPPHPTPAWLLRNLRISAEARLFYSLSQQCLVNGKCCVSLFWMSEWAPYRSLAPGLPTSSEFKNGDSLSTQIYGVVLGKTLSNLCQFLPREFWLVHSVRLKIQVMGKMCLGNGKWYMLRKCWQVQVTAAFKAATVSYEDNFQISPWPLPTWES